MRLSNRPIRPLALTVAVLVLTAALVPGAPAPVLAETEPPDQTITQSWRLHNPGFDNHRWYYFHQRYDPTYPAGPDGSQHPILPDSDYPPPDPIQDWRLWIMRGYPLIQTFSENGLIHAGVEAVTVRSYEGTIHLGGLYQPVYGVTPCRVYQFQMFGRSQPDPDQNPSASLQVGIDRVGWHPNSAVDPAVPGAFPTTTVWGAAHDYKRVYGPLSVTAEAWGAKITVYTYAYALGGRRHAILWDTGSLQDVTPAMIHDPTNLPAPGGVYGLTVTPGRTNATVNWTTAQPALGQVYYRLLPESTPVPPTYTYTVYLPYVASSAQATWLHTTLSTSPTTSHSATLTNLLPGRTYQIMAVSRGLSGGSCTTWVSPQTQFATNP